MKILHVITELKIGGESKHLVRVVDSLRAFEHSVACLSTNLDPVEAPHDVRRDLEDVGARVVDLGVARGSLSSVACAFVRLARLIRSDRPDVIHATLVHANLFAQPFAYLGKPVVCSYVDTQPWTNGWQRTLERYTGRCVAVHLANAQAVADVLAAAGLRRERIHVVRYGVDTVHFSPKGDRVDLGDGDVILGIGRLMEQKGFDLLLQAVSRLSAAPRVVILGEGPLRDALAATAHELGVDLILPGAVSDVRPYLRRANVVALSSVHEGLPNALLEALAVARPVVATAVPGHLEAIRDGHNGLLVPGRDPASFAEALKRALRDGASLGAEGRRTIVARFDWKTYAAQRAELYEWLARGRQPRAPRDRVR